MAPTASGSRRAASCSCSTPPTPATTWQTQARGCRTRPTPACCATPRPWTPTSEAGLYVGTRNGDVFASADEGATFTRILEQLPDVLCVRVAVLP